MKINENLEAAIEQLRNGQQQGFQLLYDQTHNYVLMQARMLLKNDADVDDLVQEVYINAYRSIGALQENKKIYAWLGGIAFRQATKILRKQKDFPIEEADAGLEPMIAFDEDIQPEHALDKKESAQILKEILEELPGPQKAALLAYYYDEMSIGEISRSFSCSEGTVKSRLNYARKSLKKAIEEREERDKIRLHSFSLPLLLLAFSNYAEECVMAEQMAKGLFQGTCRRLGNPWASQGGTGAAPSGQGRPLDTVSKPPLSAAADGAGKAVRKKIRTAARKAAAGKHMALAAIAGAAVIGSGIAGYGFLHQNGAPSEEKATEAQLISGTSLAKEGLSSHLQAAMEELEAAEKKAAKARAKEEAKKQKEAEEKAEEAKRKEAEKTKAEEEARRQAEEAKAEEEAKRQAAEEKAAAETKREKAEAAGGASGGEQPQDPGPATPSQPSIPEPSAPEPEPPAVTPEPEPPTPAPEPEPPSESPDGGNNLDTPDLNIE